MGLFGVPITTHMQVKQFGLRERLKLLQELLVTSSPLEVQATLVARDMKQVYITVIGECI